MGRGQIIAHLGNGQYSVRLNYAYRDRVNQKLAILSGQVADLDIRIAAETDASRRSTLNLQRAAAQKLYDYYSTKMPADPAVNAWCADLTEDMTYGTVVGTIEIPGEATTVLVRPAYDNRAVYSAPRDGQLMPSIAGEPNQVLFNWMLLPGWQRHKPIYRSGTIVSDSLDFSANTCSVCLDPAFSSQQSLPAIDGATAADCNMGDDAQSSLLTAHAADFCDRNPSHPFCTQSAGAEVYLSPQMLADLQTVNNYVNTNYGRQNDPSGLRTGDSWDVMAPGGAGDCEDFALTKMQRLVSDYGFNPDSLKMVTGYTQNGDYHAMLGVRTTNRGLVLLDVNYNEVMDNARLPYRLDKIALDSETWVNYTRRLDAVPIEYMSCNASAFADGDRVVVQFTSQDWAQPKVIGFLDNPQSCSFGGAAFPALIYVTPPETLQFTIKIPLAGEISLGAEMPFNHQNFASFYSGGAKSQVVGGRDSDGYIPDKPNTFKDDNYQYSMLADSFSRKNDYPKDILFHSAFSINGKGHVVCGAESGTIDGGGVIWEYIDEAKEYLSESDSWTSTNEPGKMRLRPHAFSIGVNGYLVDGYSDSDAPLFPSKVSEKYNYTSRSWSGFQDSSAFKVIFAASFSVGDIGVITGGYDEEDRGYGDDSSMELHSYPSPLTWHYNAILDSWSSGTNFAYDGGNGHIFGVDGWDNHGFVVGPDFASGIDDYFTETRRYYPIAGTWLSNFVRDVLIRYGSANSANG